MSDAIATNKKAFRDYFITDKWECGIVLAGSEVKSIRAGGVNFKDSFARIEKGELFLYNMHISQYAQASYMAPQEDRARKLLLHKKELKKIDNTLKIKNVTLVPLRMYFNSRGFCKVEIGLGQGKKHYDKRQDIQKRDVNRQLKRDLKNRG